MLSFWSLFWEIHNQNQELAHMILTVSIVVLVLLWYKWTIPYTRKEKTRLPPGPYGLPIVGYLPFLGSNLHEKFTNMADTYGPIFSLRLGTKLHVIVNSMDLAKVIAHDLDHTFANRVPPLTALTITYGASDVIWSNNNTHWRDMRKLLVSQVLSNTSINACQIFRTRAVRNMMNGVYAKIGTKVDINKIAFDTDLDLVTSMLWGCSEAGEGDDSIFTGGGFREVEYKIVELLGAPNISDYLPLLSCFDLQGRQREMQRQLEYVDRNFNNIIKERIKVNSRNIERGDKKDETKDFLQILLDIEDQKDTETSLNTDTATSFNIIHIKALLLDMVTAATDASSTMVEWVMAEIMHNPSVKKKVQDELTMVIGKNVVEESHLPKLSYLDAVIKETFRLHPPLPLLIQRSPDETCKVGGYTIPKGTSVSMNIWAIHRDPKNWSNPLEFKPERFLDGKWDYYGNNMKYVPFGSGRRICPGIVLGEKMLMYIVSSLLHSFDWRLPEDEVSDLSEEFGFVTKKKNSLMAIPSQRFDDDSLYI
ncbi:heme-binding cytochrome P450 [Artemisia annua]|uniref:Heme-binding cytochrome P450 n=1 Tax=Artemisia annua TaxID=35608 RepID=A0A2U1QM89_ARTAN|nr:heme-binding cytochrome P450 [Artemisia annua]